MNREQIRKLNKIKALVRKGRRRFKHRKDRDYVQDLNDLGLTVECVGTCFKFE